MDGDEAHLERYDVIDISLIANTRRYWKLMYEFYGIFPTNEKKKQRGYRIRRKVRVEQRAYYFRLSLNPGPKLTRSLSAFPRRIVEWSRITEQSFSGFSTNSSDYVHSESVHHVILRKCAVFYREQNWLREKWVRLRGECIERTRGRMI